MGASPTTAGSGIERLPPRPGSPPWAHRLREAVREFNAAEKKLLAAKSSAAITEAAHAYRDAGHRVAGLVQVGGAPVDDVLAALDHKAPEDYEGTGEHPQDGCCKGNPCIYCGSIDQPEPGEEPPRYADGTRCGGTGYVQSDSLAAIDIECSGCPDCTGKHPDPPGTRLCAAQQQDESCEGCEECLPAPDPPEAPTSFVSTPTRREKGDG